MTTCGFSIVMAPFTRGTKGRGASSGRSGPLSRGRGRGRGNANFRANRGQKSTFYSTRVEEPVQDASENDEVSIDEELDQDSTKSRSSEDEEESVAIPAIKPYNALLQSLTANVPNKEPPRKKRRLSVNRESGDPLAKSGVSVAVQELKTDPDIDHVEEQEEGSTLPTEDLDEGDAADEPDGCMFFVCVLFLRLTWPSSKCFRSASWSS